MAKIMKPALRDAGACEETMELLGKNPGSAGRNETVTF
jgi:hypothetical protein